LGEGRFSLRFALKEGEGWSPPRVIAEGANWFVNWTDFPSMVTLPDGSLAAVWLDGREMKADPNDAHGHGHGNMTLRYVKIKRDGALVDDAALDTLVCECCQTSAAMTADGPVVVYRDRSEQEIRDISIVRLRDGKWSQSRSVFADNWKINGCPVNGPSVAAAGRRVAVAWFTGADKTPRVKVGFSDDAGETFGQPVAVDDGNPAGRVDVLLLDDGGALVCWLEKLPECGAVRVRRVKPDGKLYEAVTVAHSGTARSNGFPQLARAGGELIFAWTGGRVFTAALALPQK